MDKPMRIIVAPDSFKEALDAVHVADAMIAGWSTVRPQDTLIALPVADGGEGTCAACHRALGGTWMTLPVIGPLGDDIDARWLFLPDQHTAIIEVAESSGLHRVRPLLRDPSITTTFGLGQMMQHALDNGAKRLVIGLGGSATSDGGAGMFQALGGRLLDADGDELAFGGAELARLARIDVSEFDPRIHAVTIIAATDVANPLLGAEGAAAVFGPQKGADSAMVRMLDRALANLADRFVEDLGHDVADEPGSGAAGGLGAGLMAFCGATRQSGADWILDTAGIDQFLPDTDLVITGEGRLDSQTQSGKIIRALTTRATSHDVPVIALVGALDEGFDAATCKRYGLTAAFPIGSSPAPLDIALARTASDLRRSAGMLAAVIHR